MKLELVLSELGPPKEFENAADPLEEAVEFSALSPLVSPPILLAGRIEFK